MKYKIKKIVNQGFLFLIASIFGNILNLIFNFYLGRTLTVVDFSSVALFMSILYVANIFLNAFSVTVNHSVGISPKHFRKKIIDYIFLVWRKNIFVLGVVISIIWILVSPLLADLWKVHILTVLFFVPIFIFGPIIHLNRGVLQGLLKFTQSGGVFISESMAKILLAITFVTFGMADWAYLSIPLSIVISCVISLWIIRSFKSEEKDLERWHILSRVFSGRFFLFSLFLGLSTLTFLSIDVLLVKTFFPSSIAGSYALMSLGGKIIFLLSSLLETMLISLISNAISEGKKTKEIFFVFIGISFTVILFATTFFLFFGEKFFRFFFGQKIVEMMPVMPIYIVSVALFSFSHAIVLYHHARREFLFPIVSALSFVFLIVGSIFFHVSIEQFTTLFFIVALVDIMSIFFLHIFVRDKSFDLKDEKLSLEEVFSKEIFGRHIPTVTIGIPAYNEQNNIGNILRQILLQKIDGFVVDKIVVVSDGSTDDTVKVASEFLHAGVDVIPRKENRGLNYTQNEIIKNTSTDILVMLNADILLEDNKILARLVTPIIRGADLTASWTRPLYPKTLIEHILCAGFELKYYVYTHYKNGDNIYTCIGANRGLSRKFYTNVKFPSVSGGEDQYLYLACVAGGYKYKYAGPIDAFFKLPDNFHDYKKYAKRIFQTQRKYVDTFGDVAKIERKIPLKIILQGCIYGLLKHPIYASLYIVLHIVMQQWAVRQKVNLSPTFDISVGTKKLC